jgi:hypothetical protein
VTPFRHGGERVYDRILFSRTGFPDWPPKQPPPNGGSYPEIWFHLPGQGRYRVALDPDQPLTRQPFMGFAPSVEH